MRGGGGRDREGLESPFRERLLHGLVNRYPGEVLRDLLANLRTCVDDPGQMPLVGQPCVRDSGPSARLLRHRRVCVMLLRWYSFQSSVPGASSALEVARRITGLLGPGIGGPLDRSVHRSEPHPSSPKYAPASPRLRPISALRGAVSFPRTDSWFQTRSDHLRSRTNRSGSRCGDDSLLGYHRGRFSGGARGGRSRYDPTW